MREILFRGKRVDNGEWVYGDLLQNNDAIKIREQEKNKKEIVKSFEVIPESVGQYTGLTDHDGNKIFEGDIIFWEDEFLYKNKSEVVWCGEKYNYPAFDLLKYDYECNGLQYAHDQCFIKVIGNIYDNPELLEQTND